MAELFKFRCFRCEKLLGAPASRVGSASKCPRCGADLIIPPPLDPASTGDDAPDPGAVRLEDLGLHLDPEPRKAPPTPPVETEAIAYLERLEHDPGPSEDEPIPPPEGLPDPPDPLDAPLAPPPPRRGRRPRREPRPRAGDVVLPRTAAVAWSLFALLALAMAFVAGLVIGRYRWK